MSDAALLWVASNLAVSTALAATAWLVQKRARFATVAHLLWITALVKLVTPPLFGVPVLAAPIDEASDALLAPAVVDAGVDVVPATQAGAWTVDAWTVTGCVWLLGSACVLAWSLWRIARFDKLLRRSSAGAPAALESQLTSLCDRLDLPTPPELRLTTARIMPLVWWIGGRARVYLPAAMLEALQPQQLRWVLAHELAHIRRGDHFVRWIEWLTCVGFWWNPVTWWARRNLRRNEELCCDALVLRALQGDRHDYANSLLTAVEFLAEPGVRPPAMASEINSGGFLKRRLEMIVARTPLKSSPRWLQFAAAAFAALTLPLGLAHAQKTNVRAVAERLEQAVKAGEMTKADMQAVLRTLKQSGGGRAKNGKQDRPQGRPKGRDATPQEMIEQVRRRVRAAVESGDMTPQEARKIAQERVAAIKSRDEQGGGPAALEKMKREHSALVAKLRKAVAAGELSREDMQAKVLAHRQQIAAKMKGGGRPGPKNQTDKSPMRLRLERAVKQGEMTEAEAKKAFAAAQKKQQQASAKKAAAQAKRAPKMTDADVTARMKAMKARLDAAVERGDLTKKEAKQRWTQLRKQMAAKKSAGKPKAETKPAPAKRKKKRGGDR